MSGFNYETRIKLHETDAAGILFFSNIFKITHDAFEEFLDDIGFPMSDILEKLDFDLVIVHAAADYMSPLKVDDQVSIHLNVEKIGTTSFILIYTVKGVKDKIIGKVKTVHVCIDKKSGKKKAVSEEFKSVLKAFV